MPSRLEGAPPLTNEDRAEYLIIAPARRRDSITSTSMFSFA